MRIGRGPRNGIKTIMKIAVKKRSLIQKLALLFYVLSIEGFNLKNIKQNWFMIQVADFDPTSRVNYAER
jgi:hypothetical protein